MSKGLLYPLPDDYLELTVEGQRLARVAAVSNQKSPEDTVWAWSFLRHHYLCPKEAGWYEGTLYESAPCHYNLVHSVAKYPRNCQIYPRAYGKSFLTDELCLLLCLGRGQFGVLLIKSRDDLVRRSFMRIMRQLRQNELILKDFGDLRPKKGEGIWSSSRLWLTNGFQMAGRSVSGQLLGLRMPLTIADDVEYDPILQDCPSDKTDQFRNLYYNAILPMLDEGYSFLLAGTLFSQRTFIYYVASTPLEDDPSLAYWNREVWAVYDGSPEHSTWPQKFPPDRIKQLMEEYTPAAFAAQMMNRPASDAARPLRLHDQLGWWSVREPDDAYWEAPFSSGAVMVSQVKDAKDPDRLQTVERPFSKVAQSLYRIIVADPIRKPSSSSDYACVMVIGIENSDVYRDVWWLLDMKLGRPTDAQFLEWIWQLGEKWHPRVIGVEAIGFQKSLAESATAMYDVRSASTGWAPRVFPVTYKGDLGGDRGKARRISTLAWRFDYNKIKLPRHLRAERGWRDLIDQIRNFTGDLALLRHDDALDTLAMAQFVVRPLGAAPVVDTAPETIGDLLEAGEWYLPSPGRGPKVPIVWAADLERLTPDQLRGLDEAKRREQDRRRRDREGRSLVRPAHVTLKDIYGPTS